MTKDQFKRESNYRVSLSIANRMLALNLIDKKEYIKINSMLIEKYNPICGSL